MIKKRLRALFILLGMLATSTIAFSQSTNEMTHDACGQYKAIDKKLNDVYRQILLVYDDDKVFIKNLKAAQYAWVIFKEAHLASRFPDERKRNYGSVYPMCKCDLLTDITKARVEDLKIWLIGVNEGEVCLGSVKLKSDIQKSKRRLGLMAETQATKPIKNVVRKSKV